MTRQQTLRLDLRLQSTLKGIRHRFSWKLSGSSKALAQLVMAQSQARCGLFSLPFDILLVVIALLDPLDLHRLSQVSRSFNDISQDTTIWRNFAEHLIRTPRLLVFDELSSPPTLSLRDLRRAVIRSASLDQKWGKESVRQLPSAHQKTRLYTGFLNNLIPSFSNDRFIAVPYNIELLGGLRLIHGTHIGQHPLILPFGELMVQAQDQTGTHFITLDQSAPSRPGFKLSFHIAPISFQSTLPEKYFTQSINSYDFPRDWQLIEQLLDTTNKRIYAFYTVPSDWHLRVFIIFDWTTGRSASFDTGFLYFRGSSSTCFRPASNGLEFDVCTDEEDFWSLKTYTLAQLTERTAPFQEVISSQNGLLTPTRNLSGDFDPWSDFNMNVLPSPSLYRCWTIPQPIQIPGITPTHYSHIRLYRPNLQTSATTWHVSQFYSDTRGPCRSARLLFPLKNPVMRVYNHSEHSLLLMGVSFTHMTWVELYTSASATDVTRPRRVLKLVDFRGCEEGVTDGLGKVAEMASAKTLDVPPKVLEKARSIYIEPALASIIILTEGNELHRFQYA